MLRKEVYPLGRSIPRGLSRSSHKLHEEFLHIRSMLFGVCACGLLGATAAKTIAVIGAGISGSFVAHYLSEYDTLCQATGIDVYYDDNSIILAPKAVEF